MITITMDHIGAARCVHDSIARVPPSPSDHDTVPRRDASWMPARAWTHLARSHARCTHHVHTVSATPMYAGADYGPPTSGTRSSYTQARLGVPSRSHWHVLSRLACAPGPRALYDKDVSCRIVVYMTHCTVFSIVNLRLQQANFMPVDRASGRFFPHRHGRVRYMGAQAMTSLRVTKRASPVRKVTVHGPTVDRHPHLRPTQEA